MRTNRGVSPALSQLEIHIQDLKKTRDYIQHCEAEIFRYESLIESINFDLLTYRENERFIKSRITALLDEARGEGFDDAYLERFLKDHRCKLDN